MQEISSIIHNYPSWTHGRYTSSTWERKDGVIAGGDLGGCYWGLSGEVGMLDCRWLRRVMPLGRDFCSGMALGGGTLEVDLGSPFSDSKNCGYSWESPMWWRQLMQKFQTRNLIVWTRVGIFSRVNFWYYSTLHQFPSLLPNLKLMAFILVFFAWHTPSLLLPKNLWGTIISVVLHK